MANLNGENVASNYKGIVNLQNLNEPIGLTPVFLQDGDGNNLPILVTKSEDLQNVLIVNAPEKTTVLGSSETIDGMSSVFGLRIKNQPFEKTVFVGDSVFAQQEIGFFIDSLNSVISSKYQWESNGFSMDFTNKYFVFGGVHSGFGVFIDEMNNICSIGDLNNNTKGLVFSLDSASGSFRTLDSGKIKGIDFDTITNIFKIGTRTANETFLGVDDTNETLIGSNNLITDEAGGAASQFLKINIGGRDYRIQLLNA